MEVTSEHLGEPPRHWVRRKADDDHFCLGVDIDGLAVNASRVECSMGVMGQPPLALVAPACQQLVSRFGKILRFPALADLRHHGRRNDLLAVETAIVPDHLTKARHIAECEIQATCREW